MTTQDDRPLSSGPATRPLSEPELVRDVWAPGPGSAFPATASGVPLAAFAFAFAVTTLGLVDTGILPAAAASMFIAVAFGIGAVGLLVGGLWEFRGGELFGGTFGVAYSGFLISTGLILRFFAVPITAAAGPIGFGHAFAAWLILWGIFTTVLAIGARTINLAAFLPFALAIGVFVLLAIATLGGAAAWTGTLTRIGGWVALADGAAAGYLASALLLNATVGRDMLPLRPYQSRTERG